MRVEVGVKESSMKNLVRSTYATCHVEKMGDENLTKRVDAQKLKGRCRRGKSKLRWEIALKET